MKETDGQVKVGEKDKSNNLTWEKVNTVIETITAIIGLAAVLSISSIIGFMDAIVTEVYYTHTWLLPALAACLVAVSYRVVIWFRKVVINFVKRSLRDAGYEDKVKKEEEYKEHSWAAVIMYIGLMVMLYEYVLSYIGESNQILSTIGVTQYRITAGNYVSIMLITLVAVIALILLYNKIFKNTHWVTVIVNHKRVGLFVVIALEVLIFALYLINYR